MRRHDIPFVLLATAGLLAGCGGGSSGGPAGPHQAGRLVYQGNCLACHGDDGSGHPPRQPALEGSPVVNGDARMLARWVMLGERPPGWAPPRNSMPMPRFGWLKDEDLAALLSYIRAEFGPNAAAVSAQDVAAARQAQ